jgi:hypothetical protein
MSRIQIGRFQHTYLRYDYDDPCTRYQVVVFERMDRAEVQAEFHQ